MTSGRDTLYAVELYKNTGKDLSFDTYNNWGAN